MEGLVWEIKSYLFNEKSFESLVEFNNGEIYRIIYSFLKRSGIFRDRLPKEDFNFYLFISLKEEMFDLFLTETDYEFMSTLSNFMLKKINKDLYKEEKYKKIKELRDDMAYYEEEIDSFPSLTPEEYLKMFDLKYQIALGMYFGIGRDYTLSVDEICSIMYVKRSSLFLQISKFRELLSSSL